MSRSAEFNSGVDHVKTYPEPVNVQYRYGDQFQIPAPAERKAGPLPYPETFEDYADAEYEKDWSRRQ